MTDPLNDIHLYSPTMTIAQVIKFCEKKALPISRAMVQNYIRDGLLPPPAGRKYTHKHLAAIAMICKLKTIYDIPAIKDALAPHMDEGGLPLETYKWLSQKQKEIMDLWAKHVAPGIAGEDEAMQDVLLMAHTADVKGLLSG